MGYTRETPNLKLPQWEQTDKPSYLVDQNNAYLSIDTAVTEAKAASSEAKVLAQQASDEVQTVTNLIPPIQNDVASLKTRANSLETDVTKAKADIIANTTNITSNTTAIGSIINANYQQQIDERLITNSWTFDVGADNWLITGTNGIYYSEVTTTGMLDTYKPILSYNTSPNTDVKIQEFKNMKVYEIESLAGKIILRCLEKPEVALNMTATVYVVK